MKNGKFLTVIIHGTEAMLYTEKIYPVPGAPYIPHIGCLPHVVDNKIMDAIFSYTPVVRYFDGTIFIIQRGA